MEDDVKVPQGQRGRQAIRTGEDDPISELERKRRARGEALIQPGGKPQPGGGDDLIRLLDLRRALGEQPHHTEHWNNLVAAYAAPPPKIGGKR